MNLCLHLPLPHPVLAKSLKAETQSESCRTDRWSAVISAVGTGGPAFEIRLTVLCMSCSIILFNDTSNPKAPVNSVGKPGDELKGDDCERHDDMCVDQGNVLSTVAIQEIFFRQYFDSACRDLL